MHYAAKLLYVTTHVILAYIQLSSYRITHSNGGSCIHLKTYWGLISHVTDVAFVGTRKDYFGEHRHICRYNQ
jgi:hypothetical protein